MVVWRVHILRFSKATYKGIGLGINWRSARVAHALIDTEHIVLVDRNLQCEGLSAGIGPTERDRPFGSQHGTIGRPDRLGIGRQQAIARPAKACKATTLCASGGEQANGRGILFDCVLIGRQH